MGVIGMSSVDNYVCARAACTFVCDLPGRLAVVAAASAMADAQHEGPWTEEQIWAAVAAKDTATPWSDHNGALKHFRDNVLTGDYDTERILTTDEWV